MGNSYYVYEKRTRNIGRKALTNLFGRKLLSNERLDLRVAKTDVVSFDIFDTLIFRKVKYPADLFSYIDGKENCFSQKRIEAERIARKRLNEPSIHEIYKIISDDYGYKKAEELKFKEFELEMELCCPDEEALLFYNRLLEEGRTIVIISDMYLQEKMLVDLLEKCGYFGFKKAFISCDYKCSKRAGELFNIAKKELQTDSIIHIGDNFLSDYIVPKSMGIDAFLYRR